MRISIKDYQCNGLKTLRMKHVIINTAILFFMYAGKY